MKTLKDDNGKNLPKKVQKRMDDFMDNLSKIKWFNPSKSLKKSDVDKQIKFILKCFGIEAEIEYRKLETEKDWDSARNSAMNSAWDSARNSAGDSAWNSAMNSAMNSARNSASDSAWDSAWDYASDSACDSASDSARNSAWDSARAYVELIIQDNEDFKEKYPDGAFTQFFKLWEMGLYPVGILKENKKFVVYADPKAKDLFKKTT